MEVNNIKVFMYFIVKVDLNQPNCSRETNESKIECFFRSGCGYFKMYKSISCYVKKPSWESPMMIYF